MTNYSIIKRLSKLPNDDDVVIFIGSRISKVAYNFDKPNYFYVMNDSLNLSFLIGFMFNEHRRIFVVCESDTVVRYFSSFVEIRKYFPKEFHMFILRDTVVNNTFNSMSHPQGSFFNIGFKSFKATPYLASMEDCEKLKVYMESMRDTSTFLVDFDNDVFDKYSIDIDKSYSTKDRLKAFYG